MFNNKDVPIQKYTKEDIAADRFNAKYWMISVPGWYAWDGPEGDEQISGPFDSHEQALSNYQRWHE